MIERRQDGTKRRRGMAIAAVALVVGLLGITPLWAEYEGEVQWFDLVTEDVEAAMAFYTGLVGWEFELTPTGSYIAILDDVSVAGVSEIDDAIPDVDEATWLPAVVVADLPQAVATARELGATIHEEIQRLPTYGSWAVIGDPQGAVVELVVLERDLGSTEGAGSWVWSELWTDDIDGSYGFYEAVVGWQRSEAEREEGAYPLFAWDGDPRAGLVPIGEEEEMGTGWAPYLGVDDLAAAVEKTLELGGEVLQEPAAEFGGGRIAVLADPTGGAFFVYQLEEVSE